MFPRLELSAIFNIVVFAVICCIVNPGLLVSAKILTNLTDHLKFHWISIPVSNVSHYFTSYDLDAMAYKNSTQAKICDRKYLGMTPNDDGACCLGSVSSGHRVGFHENNCMNTKPSDYFRRYVPKDADEKPHHKSHQHTNNKVLHNMADVIRVMQKHRLIMAGDSLASQVLSAADCDWRRHSIDPSIAKYSSYLSESNISPDLPNIQTFEHGDDSTIISMGFWLFDIAIANRTYKYTSSVNNHSFISSVALLRSYRPDRNFSVVQVYNNMSDVLMVNFGAHYRDQLSFYREDIMRLLKDLIPFATEKVLIWRETFPQHFDSTGGEFDSSVVVDNKWTKMDCKPVNFTKQPSLYNERNKIVVEVADSLGYHVHYVNFHQDMNTFARDSEDVNVPVLFVIATYDMFLELHSFHNSHDCTHYCNSPFVWEHIFDRLYRAIVIARKFYKRLHSRPSHAVSGLL